MAAGTMVVRPARALGTRTGPPFDLSTAGVAGMPAALRSGERRVEAVAERQRDLLGERAVVLAPVREEVARVHARQVQGSSDRPRRDSIPLRCRRTRASLLVSPGGG